MQKDQEPQNAIVLAMFGTSVEPALAGLLNIRDKIAERFPHSTVRIIFTSDIIRSIWQKRANDASYCQANPKVPEEILHVRGIEEELAALQEEGYQSVVIQAVYIAPAREYEDLCRYIDSLQSNTHEYSLRKAFRHLVIGRPVLGDIKTVYPCSADIQFAARSLTSDVRKADEQNAALVYLGHGNKHQEAKDIFNEFSIEMSRQYPDTVIVMTTLEDTETYDAAIACLRKHTIGKVLLKPFLLAAGGHVKKDMMGEQPASLRNKLQQAGFEVLPVLEGLGEQDDFARIFVRHTADAAKDAGIQLR